MESAGWEVVHEDLCRLARKKGALDAEEARLLLRAERERVWEPLGYGSLFEYLERLFGYRPRLIREKLRVAAALEERPGLLSELESAALPWSAIRELSRVCLPETEAEWIDAARGKTVREVESMVSGRGPGDTPDSAKAVEKERHVLRYDVSGDTFAAMREAIRALEIEVGHSLDDDAALRALASRVLGGPEDEGRSPYQVAMTVCEHCQSGTRDGAGVEVPVSAEVASAALCDAQVVPMDGSGVTHVSPVGDRHGRGHPASQEISPAVRRLVHRRDHGRCQVPGCRASKYLECHHIVWREDGGGHAPGNLTVLCGAHHAAVHARTISIEGTAPALVVRHRDGSLYGSRAPAAAPERGPAPKQNEPAPVPTTANAEDPAQLVRDVTACIHRLGYSKKESRTVVEAAFAGGCDSLDALIAGSIRILYPSSTVVVAEPARAGAPAAGA